MEAPCGAAHTDDSFLQPPLPQRVVCGSRGGHFSTAAAYQYDRSDSRDGKKGREEEGGGSYKKETFEVLRCVEFPSTLASPSGFTFGRRFIAHFFPPCWQARRPQTSAGGASPLIIHSQFRVNPSARGLKFSVCPGETPLRSK